MLEAHQHGHPARTFDGIVDNRSRTIPKGFALLFWGLVLWGALFTAYYLASGWSSRAEFEAAMKAGPAPAGQAR